MKRIRICLIILSLVLTGCAVNKTFHITSDPEGMPITQGGVVIGETPFDLTVPAGDTFFCTPWYWTFDLYAGSQMRRVNPCSLPDGATISFTIPEHGRTKTLEPEPQKEITRTGTGFFINKDGFIITSYHVVDGADKISVLFNDTTLPATLEGFSKGTDIAILKVVYGATPCIPLDFATTHLGDEVYTVGFPIPDLLGKDKKYSNGTINSLSGIRGDNSLLQISIPIQPGNSGGPLCNKKGNAIGIITSTAAIEYFFAKTGSIPQNVNWATKIEYAKPLINSYRMCDIDKGELSIDRVSQAVIFIIAQ